MKKLVILGAGPRGLSVALRACQYKDKLKVFIVDNNPISTWKFPNMLSNMEMRSPITFDLVTFQRDLQKYSLSNFLNQNILSETQKEVESNPIFCKRKQFVNYLKYIISTLKAEGVVFIPEQASYIDSKYIYTNKKIAYDYLVISTGRGTEVVTYPKYIPKDKLISPNEIFNNSWKNKVVNIIGSGQQSAELVEYLSRQKANIYWIQKSTPKINQYPLPSYKEWGIMSALGSYYSKANIDRLSYLKKVKDWGPSITPYINKLLNERKYTVVNNPTNTNEINMEGFFFISTGYTSNINLLKTNFSFNKNRNNTYLPDIINSFQSSSHSNIYFTGSLASYFDGPRQNSLISSGQTAHTILLSILKNHGRH